MPINPIFFVLAGLAYLGTYLVLVLRHSRNVTVSQFLLMLVWKRPNLSKKEKSVLHGSMLCCLLLLVAGTYF